MSDQNEFNVIIFGASGFTGRLVAEYMHKQYGQDQGVRWAMAGRSAEKLAAVRNELGLPADTPLVTADTDDEASLKAMVARTDVLLTTVGPYQQYGSAVVAACADMGVDYVDLTGEPLWMYDMIAAHDARARETGARIVFSCGFDSVPFDLGVFYLQNAAKEKYGAPAPRVRCRVRAMNGEFSGGTVASFLGSLKRLEAEPEIFTRMVDPFALCDGFQGPEQPAGNKVCEDELLGSWLAPFIMAPINTKNIHRSNLLTGHAYGEDFVYDEMMMAGPGEEGKAVAEMVAGMDMLAGDVPQPGEGPSKESREAGNYDVLFVGQMPDGEIIKAGVTGDMDPGYGSTSKMLAESAVCLALDCPETPGGIQTSAPAMGGKLIERLVANAGLTFNLED
ncbi:MAG: saccharopine dehydrogenase family protein [Parvibaculales bacterium]